MKTILPINGKEPGMLSYRLLGSTGLFLFFIFLTSISNNISFWITLTLTLVSGVLILQFLASALYVKFNHPPPLRPFQNLVLLICSIMVVVMGAELVLAWKEYKYSQNAKPVSGHTAKEPLNLSLDLPLDPQTIRNIQHRRDVLTLPKEWERRDVKLSGVQAAYYWHGVLHVHDVNNFRRMRAFSPKKKNAFRIMIVGDSLTYGYGIDERYTYSALLKDQLPKTQNIEVLNLGVPGYQSKDVLELVRRFLPELRPDLVFYGMCLNDFLPSLIGQYKTRGFEIPLPDNVKNFFLKSSRFSRLLSDSYDQTLRAFNLRADFFDDILRDFDGYQQRFGSDVKELNQLVTRHGLPPVFAMVLDQFPIYGGRGYKIAMTAERYLREAGIQVIGTESYYRKYDGRMLNVSRWEGHPNEEAHAIFASMIAPRIEEYLF